MISSLCLNSSSNAMPLRVGVLVSFNQLAVSRGVLEDIPQSNFAGLEMVVMHQQERFLRGGPPMFFGMVGISS